MTVDSELRKIWRKDIAELSSHMARAEELLLKLKLELEVSIHHPKIDLPKKDPDAVKKVIERVLGPPLAAMSEDVP
jgi:hypothetical protein